MIPVHTVAEIAAADAAAAAVTGEAALIATAAAGLAAVCGRLLRQRRGGVYGAQVLVLAGAGHNGADACTAGQLLARRGAAVRWVATSDRDPDEHGQRSRLGLVRCGLAEALRGCRGEADLVLDGMVGLAGTDVPLRGAAAELAAVLGPGRPPGAPLVVAVDVPSGVSTDTGAVPGPAVAADVTVTFSAAKPALVAGPAADFAGVVETVTVPAIAERLPPARLRVRQAADVGRRYADPPGTADKYSRGVVGLLAGSGRYPGAGVLSAAGAVHAGAGYVRHLAPAGPARDAVLRAFPTVVAGPGRCDAIVVGSGLPLAAADPSGTDGRRPADGGPALVAQVADLLAGDVALVCDAGALDPSLPGGGMAGLRQRGRRGVPTVITPHVGEFTRLTGVDPRPDRLGAARRVAADLGVHVLLKGQRTVLAAPDGTAEVIATGSPWLSTAGTGDVLGGALGALLAAAVTAARDAVPDLLAVAADAAFLHGLAGRLAPVPLHADDVARSWPAAVAVVRSAAAGEP